MITVLNLSNPEAGSKRPRLRLIVIVVVLVIAVFIGLLFWPADAPINPYVLSRADGKPRFCATTSLRREPTSKLTLFRKLMWKWRRFHQQHAKRNPAAYSCPVWPVRPCSIHDLLLSCMDLTGTQYLIAVEIVG